MKSFQRMVRRYRWARRVFIVLAILFILLVGVPCDLGMNLYRALRETAGDVWEVVTGFGKEWK